MEKILLSPIRINKLHLLPRSWLEEIFSDNATYIARLKNQKELAEKIYEEIHEKRKKRDFLVHQDKQYIKDIQSLPDLIFEFGFEKDIKKVEIFDEIFIVASQKIENEIDDFFSIISLPYIQYVVEFYDFIKRGLIESEKEYLQGKYVWHEDIKELLKNKNNKDC